MLKIFNDIEQGSQAWLDLRAGLVTCSEFSQVLAKGKKGKDGKEGVSKTRRTLMLKKAGERITGNPSESYSNAHMERGNEQEATARELYAQHTGSEITECGFMKKDTIGYSPDGLINDDGLIEIKSRLAHIQAESLLSDKVPSANIAQIQGGLMISGREYLDYVSYCPGMPLFIKRVTPDLEYIMNLSLEIIKFEEELEEIIQQLLNKF